MQLWDVLENVDMKEAIMSLPNGLMEPVAESGDNFSAGQRQVMTGLNLLFHLYAVPFWFKCYRSECYLFSPSHGRSCFFCIPI